MMQQILTIMIVGLFGRRHCRRRRRSQRMIENSIKYNTTRKRWMSRNMTTFEFSLQKWQGVAYGNDQGGRSSESGRIHNE
mmetsp:Transcript_3043/g.4817  ORF Transcript_3043/g.4817 Transcript_3043/m.4817 type:complete len:80 (-) Transcript_3043:392-631(-)